MAVLAALLAAGAAGPAGAAEAPSPSAATSKVVRADPAAVRSYWTERRMLAAVPAGLELDRRGELARVKAPAANRSTAPTAVPARRDAVDVSAENTSFPRRVHGKVFFTIEGGSQPGDYVCSGTVVSSNSHALAWTAGHCVNDPEFGGGFASHWTFIPGYRNGERPFGSWPARELFTTQGWSDDVDIRVDLGAARLARDAQGRGIEDVLGARGIAFNRSRSQDVTAFGYPAIPNPASLPPRFDFDGQRLHSCESPITGSDNPPGNGPETLEIDCDMTGGSSGGGWVAGGIVNGVTSYGYANDGNHLYGPYFGSVAAQLYGDASGPVIRCARREVTSLGGPGDDDFSGGSGRDTFKLKGGDDRAAGSADADAACGGGGRDRLAGAAGSDVLRGGGGRDRLVGGPGRDTCVGGGGRDVARGCEIKRGV